ncbi:MAG: hypothetical protein ACKVHP_00625 [Verrucomicrobiales bacterium]
MLAPSPLADNTLNQESETPSLQRRSSSAGFGAAETPAGPCDGKVIFARDPGVTPEW